LRSEPMLKYYFLVPDVVAPSSLPLLGVFFSSKFDIDVIWGSDTPSCLLFRLEFLNMEIFLGVFIAFIF
jgi:hypothetical protein